MTRSSNRAARQKDKLRKRQQRQQSQKIFTHLPVDNAWKNNQIDHLSIPLEHHPVSTQPSSSGTLSTETSLTAPLVLRTITPDGNCFFRCLSFVVTGNEEHYNLFRQKLCDFMLTNADVIRSFLPAVAEGDVINYLNTSQMYTNRTWASEVELYATSIFLQSDIYLYTQHGHHWTWIRYTTELSNDDQGIYLYHRNRNHFDVVAAVQNTPINDNWTNDSLYYLLQQGTPQKAIQEKNRYSSDATFKQKKQMQAKKRYQTDPHFYESKKKTSRVSYSCNDTKRKRKQQCSKLYSAKRYKSEANFQDRKNQSSKKYQKQRYMTDSTFRRKKRVTAKRKQRQKYASDKLFAFKKKKSSTLKYASNVHFRKTVKMFSKQKYASNVHFRNIVRMFAKQKYASNVHFRNTVRMFAKQKYASNVHFRNTVRMFSKQKYASNVDSRNTVRMFSKQKYASNVHFRNTVKMFSKQKYASNRNFRNTVRMFSKQKYASNVAFRNRTKLYSRKKYATQPEFRNKVKVQSRRKYSTFSVFQNFVKASSIRKYASSPLFRCRLKNYLRKQYLKSETVKISKKARVTESRKSVTKSIQKFQKDVKDTPTYVCTVCIRTLYKSQVRLCKRERYTSNGTLHDMAKECLTGDYVHDCKLKKCSKDCIFKNSNREKEWICFTCDRYLHQQSMPPQSLKNNLFLPEIPEVLSRLNILERQLISLRIAFMKLLSLPRGGQKGVKGPIVNVPSDINTVTSSLPRNFNNSQLIKVKLKRKLEYKGHHTYQWINPAYVLEALQDLLQRNIWYDGVRIDTSWINEINDSELVQPDTEDTDTEENGEQDMQEEMTTNSQQKPQTDSNDQSSFNEEDEINSIPVDSCFQPIDIGQEMLDSNKTLCIAPAEKQIPQNIFQEEGSDAMAFPVLLPNGHFGLFEERKIKLSPAKYFNVRLFSADSRFAQDKEYIFFSQYVTELNYISSNISLALRKGKPTTEKGEKVTAKMLTDSENVKEILKSDVGYRFLQPVRGTPPYWQRTMKDLYAMIRQLGIPTWFVTFSSAEMRWEEVTETLLYLNNDNRKVSDIEWSERAKMVADNPVTCARMFDHRVKVLFSDLIMSQSCPVGKVIDFFYRTEFQQRGSPHIHCLLWVKDSPKFNQNSDEEVCNFIDKYVSCKMPDEDYDPELFEIISTVQVHSKSHSKSCRKYSSICRFNFPRPPVNNTFIARAESGTEKQGTSKSKVPTSEDLDEMSRVSARTSKSILRDIWLLITTADQTSYSFKEILKLANVSYKQYQQCLQEIATRNTVHLQRSLDDIWVNNYNRDLSRAWNANLDIQFVTDSYACVAYILSYISKAETEMGDLLHNAKQEADEGNIEAAEAMKKIGNIYLQNREVSAQEAVYRVCSLHLKECTRQVNFIPAGKNIIKMSLPISIIQSKSKHSGDDENIWMTSIHEKYYSRPDSSTFNNMSLAEFSSKYRILPKSQKPKTSTSKSTLPVFELQKDLGFIQQRKPDKEAVIRFPRFNINKNPEEFYLTLIQLYMPHRSLITLPQEFQNFEDYVQTGNLNGAKIISVIEKNRHQFERDIENLEKAWQDMQDGKIQEDSWAFIAPEAELERLEIQIEKEPVSDDEVDEIPELNINDNNFKTKPKVFEYQAPKYPEKSMQQSLREMNNIQQEIFYKVRNWCLQFLTATKPDPFHFFLTGGAGTGKSHLIKCIYHISSRILSKCATSPDSTCVLLTAPTGTAAFNIQGLTIHSAFNINKKITLPYQPLSENILNTLRSKYDNLQLLIIDEVSMVDQKILTYIHGRLAQIKHSKHPFGNVSILAVGDFYQLPPVRGLSLHKSRDSDFADLWKTHFSIATLTEVMRQKQNSFAAMLNRLRVHLRGNDLHHDDEQALKSRSFERTPDHAMDFLHIFPTNKEVDKHNEEMIKKKCSPVYTCLAEDFQRDMITGKMCKKDQPYVNCATEDLQTVVQIGVGARIMLTRNLDTDDGLVNGAFGTITSIDIKNSEDVQAIYVKFDNHKVGLKQLEKTVTRKSKTDAVRIQPSEEILKGRQVTRKQLPVRLGWAATIHKVQGMTVTNIVISMKKIFQPGMAYVALSRATSLAGLHILGYDADTIYSSADITETLQQMPQFLSTESIEEQIDFPNSITLIHHNTEGLLPHLDDIKHMKALENCDVICFTETWLKPTARIPATLLPEHSSYLRGRKDSYSSSHGLKEKEKGGVAIFLRSRITHTRLSFKTENLEAVACIMQDPFQMIMVTVYRPPCYSQQLFTPALSKLLGELQLFDIPVIILGDFNFNILKHLSSEILDVFHALGYVQLVKTPTTEAGSCLDLVFCKGLSEKTQTYVVPTYYSFHDAVKVVIPI